MSIPLERYVAIDCEMVMCRGRNALARVAVVDATGGVVYDSYVFVHPSSVVSYLTSTSGIRAGDLKGAPTFETVRTHVTSLLKDKILVGHALFNDLAVLEHRHIYEDVRDTALYFPLRERMGVTHEGKFPGLRALVKEVLGREIQEGEHSPVEDARATMELFMHVRDEYEASLASGGIIAGVPNSFAKWYW